MLAGLALPAAAQRTYFQPGYVVLAAAPTDTLRGEVDLGRANRMNPQVVFRAGPQAEQRYGLGELAAAGYTSGPHYRRAPVPQAGVMMPTWLRVLVTGPASLYRDPTGKLPAPYYLDKPGSTPLPLQREQFTQVLQTAFADCPTVNTQVAYHGQYVYEAGALRRYVLNYNRCRFPQAPARATAEAPNYKERVRVGAYLGVGRVRVFYPFTTLQGPVAGPPSPVVGVLTKLPLSNHFGVVTGFLLSSLRTQANYREPLVGTSYIQQVAYRTRGSVVHWPLLMRFTLRRAEASWRPYVQGGIHMSYAVGSQLRKDVTYQDASVPVAPYVYLSSLSGPGRGLMGEAGVQWRLTGKHQLGLGLRYEQINGFPVRGRLFINDFNQYTVGLTFYPGFGPRP